MGYRKGKELHTPYGRKYTIVGGPFDTNDARHKVYAVRDDHDGIVTLEPARALEGLLDEAE